MLVLTRKPGEKIYVGDDLTLTIVEVRGNRVRLGIDAPASVPILRAELNEFRQHVGRQDLKPNLVLEGSV